MLSRIGRKKKLFLVFLMVFVVVALIIYMLKKVLERREEYEKQLRLEKEKGHAEQTILEEQEDIKVMEVSAGKDHDMIVDMKQYKQYEDFSPECLWIRNLFENTDMPEIVELQDTFDIDETDASKHCLPQVELFICYQTFTKVLRIVVISVRHLYCFQSNQSNRLNLQIVFSDTEKDTVIESSKLYELVDEIIMDEKFSFKATSQEFADKKLFLTIWSIDAFYHEYLLGAALVELDFLNYENKDTLVTDIIPVMQDNNKYGYILISLCHVPTVERLTCVVMSGKDLKTELGSTSLFNSDLNTYATISLVNDGKLMKRYKTETVLRTRDPMFNEAFYFFIPKQQLHLVDLIVMVMHKDAHGASNLIGKLLIGCHASADKLDHWNISKENSGQSFARWHSLTR